MKKSIRELAVEVGAEILAGERAADAAIEAIYAGDTISTMLETVTDRTLLVGQCFSWQLLRVAALMDVPGICLVNGEIPPPDLVEAAEEQGTCLIASPCDLMETCGLMSRCLSDQPVAAR